MPQTFFLFRHALATHSLSGYGEEILRASILPEGVPPIERMATFLNEIPTDHNFRSPVQRCQQTAEIVTKITGKIFIPDERLSEYQAANRSESFAEFSERCQNFFAEVQQAQIENILICTHGAVIAAFSHFLQKKEFLEENLTEYPSTGELWIIRDGQIEPYDFN